MKRLFFGIFMVSLLLGGSVVLLRGKSETKKNSKLVYLETEEERLTKELEKLERQQGAGEGNAGARDKIMIIREHLQRIEKKIKRMRDQLKK